MRPGLVRYKSGSDFAGHPLTLTIFVEIMTDKVILFHKKLAKVRESPGKSGGGLRSRKKETQNTFKTHLKMTCIRFVI